MIDLQWERDTAIIKETIVRACDNFDDVLLWQNINGKKITINCMMTTFLALEDKIIFNFNNSTNAQQIDTAKAIYGRCNERSLIFKSTISDIITNEITINLPTEVRVLENRTHGRDIFGINSVIYSSVEKIEDDLLGKSKFNLRLFDISQSGASFVVKTSEKKLFRVGEFLNISSFDQFQMKDPLGCEILHLTDVLQNDATSSFSFRKMGVKFDFAIPEKIYLSILERIVNED